MHNENHINPDTVLYLQAPPPVFCLMNSTSALSMSYFVPPEIVADIVQHILEDDLAPIGNYKVPGENLKPSWTLIEPLTLASRTFRQVALERWFRTLYISSATDVERLHESFPYLKGQWCR